MVVGNYFTDISGSAIQIGDVDNPNTGDVRDIPQNNQILNNYIQNIAVEYKGGIGIWVGYTQSTMISHNEISNVPYTAVSLGWGWGDPDPTIAKDNKVQFNLIYNHVNFMRDGGGIYTLGAQPGSAITGNVIKDQVNINGAIYLDNHARYYEVNNNVLFNNEMTALFKGGDHYIHDNHWQDRYLNDIWWFNDADTCRPTACGPNTITNNKIINSISEAPASIVNNAGLESAYQDIRQ